MIAYLLGNRIENCILCSDWLGLIGIDLMLRCLNACSCVCLRDAVNRTLDSNLVDG